MNVPWIKLTVTEIMTWCFFDLLHWLKYKKNFWQISRLHPLWTNFRQKKKLTLTIFIIFLSLSVCICFDVSKKYSKPLTLLFLQRRDTFWTDFLPKDCTYEVLIHLCWYQQNSWAKEVLKNSNSSNSAEPLAHLFHVSNNFTSCSSFGKVS